MRKYKATYFVHTTASTGFIDMSKKGTYMQCVIDGNSIEDCHKILKEVIDEVNACMKETINYHPFQSFILESVEIYHEKL